MTQKPSLVLDDLLRMFDYSYYQVNVKESSIKSFESYSEAYSKTETIEEWIKNILKINNIDRTERGAFVDFFSTISSKPSPFHHTIDLVSVDGHSLCFDFRGLKHDDTTVLLGFKVITHFGESNGLDTLTKVYQRQTGIEAIQNMVLNKKKFALMMVDIDFFKDINDTYGHMIGDVVLLEIAQAMKRIVDKVDGIVARIGGDEFLVAYPCDGEYNSVWEACRNLRAEVSLINNKGILKNSNVSITVGAVSYPMDGEDYDTLFLKADKALYRGKRKGRNCFIIYSVTKCGPIGVNRSIVYENNYKKIETVANDTNALSAVFEILTRNVGTKKNILDALKIIGTYYLIDRISIIAKTPDLLDYELAYEWTNDPIFKDRIVVDDNYMMAWDNCFDNSEVYRQNYMGPDVDSTPLRKLLGGSGANSVIAFSLKSEQQTYGHIRFDMCTSNRLWKQNDVYSLLLFAKIIGITLNRFYEYNKIDQQMNHDELTNLYNYSRFVVEANNLLRNNQSTQYTVMYLNICDFKDINDRIGFELGDSIIKQFALNIATSLPDGSLTGRISGDKFLAMYPFSTREQIDEIFKTITDKSNNLDSSIAKKVSAPVEVVAGSYITVLGDSISTAIDRANLARKSIKTKKTANVVYEEKFFQHLQLAQDIEDHMRDALKDHEFLVYLQPKVNMSTGEVIGAEALTRWNYKFERMLSPADFIPIFESNGFIIDLDFYVFEKVCEFIQDIKNNDLKSFPISINMSRYQFNFDNYIATIEETRKRYNVDPSDIEIEITESMLVSNVNKITQLIERLHEIGYKVSMDDFGSGYSNLSLLSDVNFDVLKLDHSFIHDESNQKDEIIIESIISMAKRLGITLICEGVETIQQAALLNQLGCFLAQGFLYARPMSMKEFKEYYVDMDNSRN